MKQGRAARVIAALTDGGAEARFVGGCVRDALVGRPVKDIDIACQLLPDAAMALLAKAGIKTVATGIEHGTITAVVDGQGIEVTTLRVDVETDGRRAIVAYTDDWLADAGRRDLTINALSCDPSGRIHDYFGGLEDLAQGRVRFVGEPGQRIAEDYLRLLRFFRFHAEFAAGDFDPASLEAAKATAKHLRSLSAERLRQETLRLLIARRGPEIWGEMLGFGVVEAYLPWATSLDRLRDVAEREQRLSLAPDPLRRLGAATMTGCGREVAQALRLSNAEKERVRRLTEARGPLDVAAAKSVRRQIYRFGNELAQDLLLLDWPGPDEALCRAALVQIRNWPRPRLPVGGEDLKRLGIEPGARMGALLERIEEWWIEGDFTADRAQCIARLAPLCRDPG